MKKWQFTENKAKLVLWCREQGYYVFEDYSLRSAEEQLRLFNAGLSKCDGVNNISAHQYGKHPQNRYASDLYICDDSWDIGKREPYEKAHEYWVSLGGRPMLDWDVAHFEA